MAGHGSPALKKNIDDAIDILRIETVHNPSLEDLLTTLKTWHEDERFHEIQQQLQRQGAAMSEVKDVLIALKDTQASREAQYELQTFVHGLHAKLDEIRANQAKLLQTTDSGANKEDGGGAEKMNVSTDGAANYVSDSSGKDCDEKREGNKKRERKAMLGRQIHSQRKVNVKLATDSKHPLISGCAVMSNDNIVLCDFNNQTLKLLDTTLSHLESLDLPSPWDVSVVDDNNVIVSLSYNKQLQYVQRFPWLQKGRILQLDKKCWGVAVSGDDIYVSCHNDPGDGEVRVLDKQVNIKRRLGFTETGAVPFQRTRFLFSGPSYIAVSRAGDTVFVSDWKTHTITITCIMAMDGNIIYTYKDEDLVSPKGLNCDDNDNILVCDLDSKNVQ